MLVGVPHPSLRGSKRASGAIERTTANKRVASGLGQYTFDSRILFALSSIPFRAFHHYGAERFCLVRR